VKVKSSGDCGGRNSIIFGEDCLAKVGRKGCCRPEERNDLMLMNDDLSGAVGRPLGRGL